MRKAAVLILLLLFGCGMFTRGVEFSTLASGYDAAGITEQINEVFIDSESFNSFWTIISANKTPAPEAPAVDFSKDMVIAVSPGEMSSGGYTVEITKVASDGKKLAVTVAVTKPTGFATMVLTQPYHIIRLEKTDLPVEFTWEERLSSSTDKSE